MDQLVETPEFNNPNLFRDRITERMRVVEREIEALQKEYDALVSDLDVTDHFIAVWRRANNMPDLVKPANVLRIGGLASPAPAGRPRNPAREKVVESALALIQAAGRPLNRAELYEALKSINMEVFGKDPLMVLSTMLWRSQDQIVRLKDLGYWPKDTPYEPAQYFPSLDELIGAAAREPEDELEEPEG